MLTCSRCGEVKPRSAFTPRKDRKRGAHSHCKECCVQNTKQSAERDRKKYLARRRAQYAANAEELAASALERYYKDHETSKARHREWARKNRIRVYADNRQRKSMKAGATPAWVNTRELAALYEEAVRLTQETGVEHHVDHIVPLRSKLVCGLHVPANLRIIPKLENLSKGNRHWPDMP